MINIILILTLISMFLFPKNGIAQDQGTDRNLLVLPHLKEFVPGVYATGFAHKHKSANCGWISLSNGCMLVDLPRGMELKVFLNEVERISGTAPNTLVQS